MNKNNFLAFNDRFICPYCFARIELGTLELQTLRLDEIKEGIFKEMEHVLEEVSNNDIAQEISRNLNDIKEGSKLDDYIYSAPTLYYCDECEKIIMWHNDELIYPDICYLVPAKDMPDEIRETYKKALIAFTDSIQCSIVMLRTALEQLLKYIIDKDTEKCKNLKEIIDNLFENKKIDETTKKALHLIRIMGNNAAHSNENNNKIDNEAIKFLFEVFNGVSKNLLTYKGRIEEIYSLLPENAKRENREK